MFDISLSPFSSISKKTTAAAIKIYLKRISPNMESRGKKFPAIFPNIFFSMSSNYLQK